MRSFIFVLCLFSVLLSTRNSFAVCETHGTIQEIRSLVSAGERAFEEMEQTELLVSRDKALGLLRCLQEEMRPKDVENLFWLMALAQFTTDREQTLTTLKAIWLLDSDREIGEAFAPSDQHPLAKLYQKAKFLPWRL